MYGCCNATGRYLEFLSLSTKDPHLWILRYAALKRAFMRAQLQKLISMTHHQTPEFDNLRKVLEKALFPGIWPVDSPTHLAVTQEPSGRGPHSFPLEKGHYH